MVLVFLDVTDNMVRVHICVDLVTQRLEDMNLTDERIAQYVKKYEYCGGFGYLLFESLFRNTIQSFFRTLPRKKRFAPGRCDICHQRPEQLQRAHSWCTRIEIGKRVCHGRGDHVLSCFLKSHRTVPLWILCKKCHMKWPTWHGDSEYA